MFDMGALQNAVVGLQTAGKLAKALQDLDTSIEIKTRVIELQGTILEAQNSALAAQSQQFSMIQRVRDLEEEVTRMKAWEKEKERYKLVQPFGGAVVVYALKESCKGTEIPHWICTKCYDDGRRTILQIKKRDGWVVLACPTCKLEADTGYRGVGAAEYAKD